MEDRRVRKTKQLLCEAFISLLKQKPIDKISVTELCRTADINRGSFYAHYTDVYDLLDKTEDAVFAHLCAAVRECNYTECDFSLINNIIETIKKERAFCDALFGKHGSKLFLDKCCEVSRQDITDEWHREFPSLDSRVLNVTYTFMVKGSLGIIEEWVNNDFSAPCELVSSAICEIYSAVLAKLDCMQKNHRAEK